MTSFKVHVPQEATGDSQPSKEGMPGVKFATIRRGAGSYFKDFQAFVESLQVRRVVSMCQSESDGNITLTIAYE